MVLLFFYCLINIICGQFVVILILFLNLLGIRNGNQDVSWLCFLFCFLLVEVFWQNFISFQGA